MKLKDLREGMNRSRKEAGEKPIHHKRFRAMLRDIGMREGMELKRLPGEGNHILVLTENAQKCLSKYASQRSFTPRPGWFTEALDTSQNREVSMGDVKNKEEEVKELRHACEASIGVMSSREGCFTVDGVCTKTSIPRETVEKWISHWVTRGEVYSPTEGEYRFL